MNKKIFIALALIVMFGTVLRFYHIGRESLWFDELFTADCCGYPTLTQAVTEGNIRDNNPPVHHIIVYFFMKYLGDSEAVVRAPSAIAGVLSIILLFFLGRYLFSYKEGLIAAALLAVLWEPVFYSQEARAYSLLLMFSLLTMYLWKKLLDTLDKNEFRYPLMAAYALTAVLCAYTHYFGVFLVFLQGVALFLLFIGRKKPLLNVVFLYLAVFLAFAPWLPVVQRSASVSKFWIPPASAINLLKYLRYAFNDSWYLLFAAAPFFLFYLYSAVRRFGRRRYLSARELFISPDMIVLLWLAVPVTITYVKSLVSMPLFLERYLIISLPAVYLLFARGITLLPVSTRRQMFLAALVVAVCSADLIIGMRYYREPQKQQWREAVQYILVKDRLPAPSVIVGFNHDFRGYYFRRAGSGKKVLLTAGLNGDIPKVEALITTKKPQYVWYLYGHGRPDAQFIQHLTSKYNVVRKKQFVSTAVYLFETANKRE